MADKKDSKKRGDANEVSTEFDGPHNRIHDVHAGDPSGGPVNPVKDADPDYQEADDSAKGGRVLFPWEADPSKEADNSSASTIQVVNEAREAGSPFGQPDDSRPGDGQPAVTPAGTGTSAGATAGSADT